MKLNNFKEKNFHFIGCGGAGMSCLCIILKELGANVSGSDIKESETTSLLRKKGVKVFIGHSAKNIPDKKLAPIIVSSAAIRDDNPELSFAKSADLPCFTRGEFLANLSKRYNRTVAIAGSHGKTSITAMIACALESLGLSPAYMIGGKVSGKESPASAGNGDIFVSESDESDGSLTLMQPHIGIISNIDDDHSWSVGGENAVIENFIKFAKNSRRLVYLNSEPESSLLCFHRCAFPVEKRHAEEIKSDKLSGFQKQNAAIAIRTLELLGIDKSSALRALQKFPGVERRMSIRLDNQKITIVEDYAHHPTELSASIATIQEKWPDKRLFVVFQPHRQARLEKYFKNFACELRKADKALILPVFAAWCDKGKLSSSDLAKEIGNSAKFADDSWENLANIVAQDSQPGDMIAIIGAGDINEIIPHLCQILK